MVFGINGVHNKSDVQSEQKQTTTNIFSIQTFTQYLTEPSGTAKSDNFEILTCSDIWSKILIRFLM